MRKSLEQRGYKVDVANESREGLRRILVHPPQCLVLDVVLPALSGYAVCRRIRQADTQHTLPIIMVSSKSTLLDKKYALDVGADKYLTKPFSGQTLVEAVDAALPEGVRLPPSQPSHHPDAQRTEAPDQSLRIFGGMIPFRQREAEILTISSPFENTSLLSNMQLRQVYSAINDQRTVQALSERLQLDMQALLALLNVLWQQHFITFYDTSHRPLKDLPFLLSEH